MPVDQMTMTLGSWLRKQRRRRVALPPILDEDLKRLLPAAAGEAAADALTPGRHQLVRDVHYWTGVDRLLLAALVDALLHRIRVLGLRIEDGQTAVQMASLSVFVTTLATNYLKTGQFVEA